jgi:hypothetical protein
VTQLTKSKAKKHEKAVIVIEKLQEETAKNTSTPPPAAAAIAAPLSAIAARRAAMNAGLYKPVEESEEEQEEASEDEIFAQNYEGIEVQSVTDEEDLGDQLDEDRVKSPISGAATPNGGFTPSATVLETKSKNKM